MDPRPPPSSSPSGARPTLRPGRVPRHRGDGRIHLDAHPAPVVLVDTAPIRSLLRGLAVGADLRESFGEPARWPIEVADALRRLDAAGLLVSTGEVLRVLGSGDGIAPGAVTALFAEEPTSAARRLRRRGGSKWVVEGPAAWDEELCGLLTSQGVDVTPVRRHSRADSRADGEVVITLGEPAREEADRMVRDGRTHLWVAVLADRARVGPFVVPGTTACLRCVDAGLAERDPHLLAASTSLRVGATALPAPADPLTLRTALAWAARDVLAAVDGEHPSSWSTTVEIPLVGAPRHRTWLRHPWCGCAWDAIDIA